MKWKGLDVEPEERCSEYESRDYSYPQSVEDELTALYGGVYSPYTGEWWRSDTRTDIEHIVARSEAHDSGLCAASAGIRRDFSRDLLNLTLAAPDVNRFKSAKDAADWTPVLNKCWFANRVVAVKLKYGLSVDMAERDALASVLDGCGNVDLVIYPPDAGPLSGIYTAPGNQEALVIIQDFEGSTIEVTLKFDTGPEGEIVPTTWDVAVGASVEPPAGHVRYFPDGEPEILEESVAVAVC